LCDEKIVPGEISSAVIGRRGSSLYTMPLEDIKMECRQRHTHTAFDLWRLI